MLKKIKKWSTKKKVWVSIIIFVLLALIATVIYVNFKPEELPAYEVAAVTKGDLQTTFDTQGIVSSDNTKTFQAAAGVKVLTVDVKVGDRVKEGQVLATFDVSSLSPQIAAYQEAAKKAKESYDKASATNANARKQISEIDKETKSLQNQIANLKKEIAQKEAALEELKNMPKPSKEELKKVYEELKKNGGLTLEEQKELEKLLKENKGDIETTLKDNLAAKKLELTKAETKLSSLEAQKPLYEAQTDETMTDIYKTVMEQKTKERDSYLEIVNTLKKGWVAEQDSLVTEVNLTAGQAFVPVVAENGMDMSKILSMVSEDANATAVLSQIFSTTNGSDKAVGVGMVLECYGDFYADFTVGKYDLQNLKVGQKATILSLDKTYDAEVTYVSATANAQAGFDISSIASSIAGGSTTSANSAPVRVKITNPDEKIVIGFDVDVQINTEKLENITKIPIEAVTTADGENCVFVYNSEKKIAEKRSLTLGAGTDSEYEVVEGLEIGEQVILNPKTVLQDGDKIQIKA